MAMNNPLGVLNRIGRSQSVLTMPPNPIVTPSPGGTNNCSTASTASTSTTNSDDDIVEENFQELLYLQQERPEAELVESWRFLNKLSDAKNPVASRSARRLENASWRTWASARIDHKESVKDPKRFQTEPFTISSEALTDLADDSLVGRTLDFIKAFEPQEDADGISESISEIELEADSATEDDATVPANRTKAKRRFMLRKFEHFVRKARLQDEQLQWLLHWIHAPEFYQQLLPEKVQDLRKVLSETRNRVMLRPVCALFSHSLQRNGANNFLLSMVGGMLAEQRFELYSPSDGPMRADFEACGGKVFIVNTSSEEGQITLRECLTGVSTLGTSRPGLCLANTIMRAEVVEMAHEMGIPTLWVIHEAWPQNEFEHYAKNVFMMAHIDADLIRRAFKLADRVVFPSYVQHNLYDGLFDAKKASTVYNGIPLANLKKFKQMQDRTLVRASLGYKPSDFVVLHLGTVCERKAQLSTAKAFAKMVKEDRDAGKESNLKLLIVGCRYIRDHEIKYIDAIKKVLADANLGDDMVTLMDIQKNVLQFYMAADVVVVPSQNEVLPLVVCEAMAFEVPVVASKIDGIPEAMDDGVEGFLIPAADVEGIVTSVNRLRKDDKLRSEMSKNGLARVEKQFSFGTMCKTYQTEIDKLYEEEKDFNVPVPVMDEGAIRAVGGTEENPFQQTAGTLKGRTILVDMDNTLVDWDGEFISRWIRSKNLSHNSEKISEFANMIRTREHFEIEKNFESEEDKEHVLEIIKSEGFYESLQPFPGALDQLREMAAMGINIRLVTAPHPACWATCASDKFKWVGKHLGEEWLDKLIIVRDKTLVAGDLLLDDKPKVTGISTPTWKHVWYSQSYNANHEGGARLSNWLDWKMVLPAAMY